MQEAQLVLYDEDFRRILAVTQRLVRHANAKGVFVVDRNGQLISEAGEMRGIDTTSLASLTAGSVAATGGLAKIVGEEEFPVHFHQGQRDNLHITLIAGRIIPALATTTSMVSIAAQASHQRTSQHKHRQCHINDCDHSTRGQMIAAA